MDQRSEKIQQAIEQERERKEQTVSCKGLISVMHRVHVV